MHDLWPWILLGLLGAYHGLNPAMGWLFAVALGMQERDRRAVSRALPAIAIGHEASILVIAGLVLGLGLITDPSALHLGAGVALIAFGLFRFIKPRAHFRWVMRGNVGPRELADALGCSVEEIVEGIESGNAYSTLSLDATDDSGDDGGVSMLEMMGLDDEELEQVEIRESIKPLLEALPSREKQILLLRFFRNKTQSEIAAEIGVSQMHVSRLLSRTLAELRTSLQETG